MRLLPLLTTLLTVFETSKCFDAFVPVGKEFIYEYQATLSTGTPLPVPYTSKFDLTGKLHVQSNKAGLIYVKLSNLTYTLYNGPIHAEHSSKIYEVELPQNVQSLQNVFGINYNKIGISLGIGFSVNETEYIRNIKKSIASILQLTPEVVIKEDSDTVFKIEEPSLYGKQLASYIVTRNGDQIQVEKNYNELNVYDENFQRFFPNIFETNPICDVPVQSPLINKVTRNYVLKIKNNETVVEEVLSQGVIFFNPFNSNSDSKFVNAIHNLKLIEVLQVNDYSQVELTQRDNDLSYFVVDEDFETEALPDLTNGREVVRFDELKITVQEYLEYTANHFEIDHLVSKTPDILHINSLNHLQRVLKYFDFEKLEELHQSLLTKPKLLNIFYEILPFVGSKASILLIKKFVVKQIVDSGIAENLLQTFPDFVVMPSRNLVTELEEIFRLNSTYDWEVRNVAILSFGTIVNKAYRYEQKKMRATNKKQDEDVSKVIEYYEKFVIEYVEMIRDVEEYKIKIAYLQGLSNMKMQSALKLLQPALDGDWWHCRAKFMHWQNCHHLKLHVMFSLFSIAITKNPLTVYELYLPILASKHEHPELKMAAFYFIMESKPQQSILYNLLRITQTEVDSEAYRFYYTYVKFNKDTTDTCHEIFKQGLRHIFKHMKKPAEGVSNAFLMDSIDTKFGFGMGIETVVASTDASRIYVLTGKGQIDGNYNQNGVLIKLYGLPNLDYPLSYETMMKQNFKNVKIEIVFYNHQRFINSYIIDCHNFEQIEFILTYLLVTKQPSLNKEWLKFVTELSSTLLIPTDLGMPTIFEYAFPMVLKYNVSLSAHLINQQAIYFDVESSFRYSINHKSGFTVYNTIADIWHGIHRINTLNYVIPINFAVLANNNTKSIAISWKKNKDALRDVGGIRTHATTIVFFRDDFHKKIYLKSCPFCKQIDIASKGKQHRHTYTLMQNQILASGHKWQVEVFDSETRVTNGSLTQKMKTFFQPTTNHFESFTDRVALGINNFYTYLILLPDPGTYGFLIRIEPIEEVDSFDLIIHFNEEFIVDDFEFLRPKEWKSRITYTVKSLNQNLQKWELNSLIKTNSDHTLNSYKFDLSRIFFNQDQPKYCVNVEEKWKQEGLFGYANVGMSKSNEGKCDTEPIITIDMKGERSSEQNEDSFNNCLSSVSAIKCLGVYNSLRNYTYVVKVKDLPKEVKSIFEMLWEQFKDDNWNYFHQHESTKAVNYSNLLINIFYPLQGNEMDFIFTVVDRTYEFSGIPKKMQWPRLDGGPHLPPSFREIYELNSKNLYNYCYIRNNQLEHGLGAFEGLPKNWTLYLDNKSQPLQRAIYLKKLENNKIAVHVVLANSSVEIVPNSADFQILQENLPNDKSSGEWIQLKKFKENDLNKIVALVPKFRIYLEHAGNEILIAVPKGKNWEGKCISN